MTDLDMTAIGESEGGLRFITEEEVVMNLFGLFE
jgi:hypothetical protein